MKTVTTLFLSTVLVACQSTNTESIIDIAALTRSLLETDQAFAVLSEESGPKTAFAAFLAPDAIMIPREGDPKEGYAQAISSFGDDPGYDLLWQPQMAEVAGSGDMGWTWGYYQVEVDGTQISSGKYINIWKMQPDGKWKVRLDMGNSEPDQKPELK
jgi:ketosteroid isomerase-like protein